jgi:hypothetical protein
VCWVTCRCNARITPAGPLASPLPVAARRPLLGLRKPLHSRLPEAIHLGAHPRRPSHFLRSRGWQQPTRRQHTQLHIAGAIRHRRRQHPGIRADLLTRHLASDFSKASMLGRAFPPLQMCPRARASASLRQLTRACSTAVIYHSPDDARGQSRDLADQAMCGRQMQLKVSPACHSQTLQLEQHLQSRQCRHTCGLRRINCGADLIAAAARAGVMLC